MNGMPLSRSLSILQFAFCLFSELISAFIIEQERGNVVGAQLSSPETQFLFTFLLPIVPDFAGISYLL